jgi:hypothetical protein
LTDWEKSLLLGTLLGDGSISGGNCYVASHGLPQAEYLWTKYTFLSEFALGQPLISKKNKCGYRSLRFTTRASPAFAFLRGLCYPGNIKTVTARWLDLIDEAGFMQAMAWWIGDDGTRLQKGRSASLQMCTQGFQFPEVELLREWLLGHGYESTLGTQRRKGYRDYPVLFFPVAASLRLMAAVLPLTPPCLRYKVELPERIWSQTCVYCNREFSAESSGRKFLRHTAKPCCRQQKCLAARATEWAQKSAADSTKVAATNKKSRDRYLADDAYRDHRRNLNRLWRQKNPEANRKSVAKAKAKYQQKKKDEAMLTLFSCPLCGQSEPLGVTHVDRLVCIACRPALMRANAMRRHWVKRLAIPTLGVTARAAAETELAKLSDYLAPVYARKNSSA